jgi:hypothetical protein
MVGSVGQVIDRRSIERLAAARFCAHPTSLKERRPVIA